MGCGRSGFCSTSRKGTFHDYSKRHPITIQKTVNTEKKEEIIVSDERFVDSMKEIGPVGLNRSHIFKGARSHGLQHEREYANSRLFSRA